LVVALAAVVAAGVLTACNEPPPGGVQTTITVVDAPAICSLDAGYSLPCQLNNSGGGPSPVIEAGVANSCLQAPAEGGGVGRLCRVVDGYERIGDMRNWIIRIDFGNPASEDWIAGWTDSGTRGLPWTRYGRVIVLHDGTMFEGCTLEGLARYTIDSDFTKYRCNYRIRKPVTTHIDGHGWDQFLAALWPNFVGDADMAACAVGFTTAVGGWFARALATWCVQTALR
jgi:hypothetical protein